MKKFLNYKVGQLVNNFEIISFSHKDNNRAYWNIKCFCGKIFPCYSSSIKKQKSCGCIKKQIAQENAKKAIKWKNREFKNLYVLWSNMKRRCLNSTDSHYHRYGGRGISIYIPWINNFDLFSDYILQSIGDKPSKLYTLDRVDNNKNYEPENLKWSTLAEQVQNSTKAKLNLNQVEKIRKSTKTNKILAKEYKVPIRLINRIISGETWK